jgi:hypothetical protein
MSVQRHKYLWRYVHHSTYDHLGQPIIDIGASSPTFSFGFRPWRYFPVGWYLAFEPGNEWMHRLDENCYLTGSGYVCPCGGRPARDNAPGTDKLLGDWYVFSTQDQSQPRH